MVELLDMVVGFIFSFDFYKVVEIYFKDLDKWREINFLLGIIDNMYDFIEDFGVC